MHDLIYELRALTARQTTGSYATQANRRAMLQLMGEQLVAAGYKHFHAYEIKGRHVNRLLALWQEQRLTPATVKNRLAVLRWWANHVGNPGAVKSTNAAYGIPQRQTVAQGSKARELPADKLDQITNRHVRMSLELQRAFGLRREESIKIKPHQADHGSTLVLQASWTKGGRARVIPIGTTAQRAVLDRAKALARFQDRSLIPVGTRYVEQLHRYESQTTRAGLSKMHGLRHAYAQARFLELAGFACPAAGGPHTGQLTPQQREADYDARLIISAELGHVREAITAVYLGR
jgi:integrase